MSESGLKKLAVALLVGLALWAGLTVLGGGADDPDAPSELTRMLDRFGPDASPVTLVRMRKPDGSVVELSPRDSGYAHWSVNGLPADSGIAARLWQSLGSAEVAGLAARNPENHERMGVSAGTAIQLEVVGEVAGEGEPTILLVGNAGPRFGTTYVRLPDDDRVFALEADWRGQMGRELEMWRSKRMVAIETAAVGGLEVERDGEAYSLVRGDSTWSFVDGSDADQTTVRNALTELRDLQATGFVLPGDSIADLGEGGSLTVTSSAGEVLTTLTMGSGTGDRWARVAGDTVTYRITSFRADRVAPPLERARPSG